MNSDDEIFYQNQCFHLQIGYCTNFTTRKDILTQKRKEKEHEKHTELSGARTISNYYRELIAVIL